MWSEIPLRLFLAALSPLVVILPLRAVWFADVDPLTVIVLGPAFEESLKLSAAILVLTLASLTLRGGRDPELALRYWLFLLPWAVGGAFGLFEALAVFPREPGATVTLRELAHATFVALAVSGCLEVWRHPGSAYLGIGFGLGAGLAGHIVFNVIAVLTSLDPATELLLAAYVACLLAFAVPALAWEVRRVPSSDETRAFLPPRETWPHP